MSNPPPNVAQAAGIVNQWLNEVENTRLSPEQIAALSPAERIDYCRRFDQSKMPAWRDPRAK
jgi:hypothetical protein